MKVLYFDCFSGISGDMTLGAFIDIGIDKEEFLEEINKLNIEGFDIEFSKVKKNGIEATDVNINIHKNCNEHEGDDHHEHHHRNLQDIEKIIKDSNLDNRVKELSKAMFLNIAKAEAKIHGTSIDKIHFHEVGAIDSIIDIIGVAICINLLGIEKIISSPLHDGTGFVRCQHGLIPIPAPATLEILTTNNVPFYTSDIKNELITPTGATIIATLVEEFGPIPEMSIKKIGYGSGKRDLEIPNLLRIIIGEVKKKS